MYIISKKVAAIAAISFWLSFSWSAQAGQRVVVVDFSEAILALYEEGSSQPLARFPVVVPRKSEEPSRFPVYGRVTQVVRKPYWYPTSNIRKIFFEKKGVELPEIIPPGDKLNAMGTMKILIAYDDSGAIASTVRIHGTNEPHLFKLPPSRRHQSSGCIRMLNQDAETLGSLIEASLSPVLVVLRE